MNRILFIILVSGAFIMVSCSLRSDIVFSGVDELHYIVLYEKDDEFELLYNGYNTAIGTYTLSGDTIHLTYMEDQFEEFDPNEKLTRKILIDKGSTRVKSLDDRMQFCANIDIDRRKIKTSHNNT